MKQMKLIFPLMFLIALAGSAFSRHSRSSKSDGAIAYYYDPRYNSCYPVELEDDKCMSDNLGYVCLEYIPGVGFQDMFQYGLGMTCYQPFYAYVP